MPARRADLPPSTRRRQADSPGCQPRGCIAAKTYCPSASRPATRRPNSPQWQGRSPLRRRARASRRRSPEPQGPATAAPHHRGAPGLAASSRGRARRGSALRSHGRTGGAPFVSTRRARGHPAIAARCSEAPTCRASKSFVHARASTIAADAEAARYGMVVIVARVRYARHSPGRQPACPQREPQLGQRVCAAVGFHRLFMNDGHPARKSRFAPGLSAAGLEVFSIDPRQAHARPQHI